MFLCLFSLKYRQLSTLEKVAEKDYKDKKTKS